MDAIAKRIPVLKVKSLPASSVNMTQGIPATEIRYLTYTASLVVPKKLDSSLVLVLAEGAQKIYSAQTLTTDKDELPTFSRTEFLEPSPIAAEFYERGSQFLNNFLIEHMSATFAIYLAKMAFIFIPLLSVLVPILHFSPRIYNFYIRHKTTHWYAELQFIEYHYLECTSQERSAMVRRLDEIDNILRKTKLPFFHTHYVQEIFRTRRHLDDGTEPHVLRRHGDLGLDERQQGHDVDEEARGGLRCAGDHRHHGTGPRQIGRAHV